MCPVDQGLPGMIRIDTIWLALGVSDLRAGMDTLLARVVQNIEGGARLHCAYVFANRVPLASKCWSTTVRACGYAPDACSRGALSGRKTSWQSPLCASPKPNGTGSSQGHLGSTWGPHKALLRSKFRAGLGKT
jgi:hypothetical protein